VPFVSSDRAVSVLNLSKQNSVTGADVGGPYRPGFTGVRL